MSQILIIEDEPRIAAFVAKGLKAAGYSGHIQSSGAIGAQLAVTDDFDLVILDVGLPDIDGFEALNRLRGQGVTTPVIMLTARSSVTDTVAGLEGGADDYMAKPFSFEELLARVRLRLRSDSNAGAAASTLSHGGLSLDLRTRRARVGDREVDLSAREFTLAEAFLTNPGQVLSREQLLSSGGATTSTRVRTSSTSMYGIAAASSAPNGSKPCAAWAIGWSEAGRVHIAGRSHHGVAADGCVVGLFAVCGEGAVTFLAPPESESVAVPPLACSDAFVAGGRDRVDSAGLATTTAGPTCSLTDAGLDAQPPAPSTARPSTPVTIQRGARVGASMRRVKPSSMSHVGEFDERTLIKAPAGRAPATPGPDRGAPALWRCRLRPPG